MLQFSLIFQNFFRSRCSQRRWVTGLCFLSGFMWGIMSEWNWQHAVEGAQVIAGIVKYPPDNPFFIYQIKLWTLMHQIPAVLLNLGVSERALSILLSGLIPGFFYAGLGLLVFLLSGKFFIALLAPTLIHSTTLAQHGTVYEVFLAGVPTTYGVIGLGWIFLAVVLIGAEEYFLGALFLGVAPAVHPTLGMLIWMVTGTACLIHFQRLKPLIKKSLPGFYAGCVATALSFIVHQWMVWKYAPGPSVYDAALYADYVKFWDYHRVPVAWNSSDVLINLGVLITARLIEKKHALQLNSRISLTWLWKCFQIAAIGSFVFGLLTWLPPEIFPMRLLGLMPARLFSFNILAYGALLFGIFSRERGKLSSILLWVSFILCLIGRDYFLFPLFRQTLTQLLFFNGVWMVLSMNQNPVSRISSTLLIWVKQVCIVCGYAALLYCLGMNGLSMIRTWTPDYSMLQDQSNQPFFKRVKERPGLLLLAPDLATIQLITWRPVLLDVGILDAMGYVPEISTLTDAMMKKIYHVDLRKPYPDKDLVRKDLWQERSVEEWSALAKEFGFTDVMTASDWQLTLKRVDENPDYFLWEIPNYSGDR